MSLREGFGVGFRMVGGRVVLLWKRREKEKGWGGGQAIGKSMRKHCRHYPLAIYPLVFAR